MHKKKQNNLDSGTLFWGGIGILLIIVFVFSFYLRNFSSDLVNLKIDFGNGTMRNFQSAYKPGLTAWSLLQQANAVYSIPIEIEGTFRPKSIGERKNGEEGKHWNFYLNGKIQQKSPFEINLSGGETILFKFE
ncbi:hypothetical protein HYT00_00080 [Candidatus Giovannonibacteria bacterium]|nr:hypothetical protein [Candidatus Giovannonibacteria bacterium]